MVAKSGDVVAISSFGTMNEAETPQKDMRREVYKHTGVDTAEADAGLANIVSRVQRTWPKSGFGRVVLDIGYFANVVDAGGIGIALCTDGVGSKTIIADMMKKYDTIGIDCIAMNVNDMICVGARPISLVDYIAVERVDASMLDAVGVGLCKGAQMAQISISGGETAQLKDVIKGFDLVGMAIGRVDLDKVIDGRNVREGDVIIGVKSNGVHSNGLTLARRAFFDNSEFAIDHRFKELDVGIGEELMRPTDIYVREAMEIIEQVAGLKALINITSDGLLNLARVNSNVGFIIDNLIKPQPIFDLIQQHADVPDTEMFEVFNMGIGFCYVVDQRDADTTIAILRKYGRQAQQIGRAVSDPEKRVYIRERSLVGQHKTFWKEERAARKAI
jgi:phosphoribosylformylglycinamidine cyclo-ligase